MAIDSPVGSAMSLRLAQILGSADALPTDLTNPGTQATALLIAAIDAAEPNLASADMAGSSDPTAGVTALANAAVLQFHSDIEGIADQNGLIGSVHGLTNLGETAGLGHIGGANLLTDAAGLPTALASGDTSAIGTIVPDTTAVATALDGLAGGTASDAGANPAILAPVDSAVPTLQSVGVAPAATLANTAVLDLHAAIEAGGDQAALVGTTHGITGLGETVGLGEIGGANLVTDVLDAPPALLAGDTTPITDLPADAAAIVGAAQNLVSGASGDLTDGMFLSDPVGHATGALATLSSLPVDSLANEAIDTVHASAETILDPTAPGTIHGIIGIGNATGLGELGGSNLLTDVTQAPTSLIAGDTTSLTNVPTDVASIGAAASNALDGVGSDLGSSAAVDSLTHPLTGGGALGGDLPGQGEIGTVTSTVDSAVNDIGVGTGLGATTSVGSPAIGTLEGSSSPVDGVAHLPGDIVSGASMGASPLPSEVDSSVASIGTIAGAAAGEIPHLGAIGGSPVTELGDLPTVSSALGDTTGTLTHADPIGLASIATALLAPATGGGAGSLAGTATGLLGASSASGSGSHDLATVVIGPQTPVSGAGIDVLSNGSGGQTHLVDSHVGSVAAPVPTVATVGVLSDGSFHFPTLTGGGDALSGVLHPAGASAAPSLGDTDVHTGIDAGAAHIDLPIAAAHADPLGALAHPVAHV